MKLRCKSCLAEYETVQRDGAPYFHACSPEVVQPAVADIAGKVTQPEVRTPRANPRDENIDVAAFKALTKNGMEDLTGAVPIKSAGTGVTVL